MTEDEGEDGAPKIPNSNKWWEDEKEYEMGSKPEEGASSTKEVAQKQMLASAPEQTRAKTMAEKAMQRLKDKEVWIVPETPRPQVGNAHSNRKEKSADPRVGRIAARAMRKVLHPQESQRKESEETPKIAEETPKIAEETPKTAAEQPEEEIP